MLDMDVTSGLTYMDISYAYAHLEPSADAMSGFQQGARFQRLGQHDVSALG